jgi:hypothetical protein
VMSTNDGDVVRRIVKVVCSLWRPTHGRALHK